MSPRLRASFILKYMRVNFLPAVQDFVTADDWTPDQARTAQAVARELLAFAPHVEDRLSRADRRVLQLLTPDAAPEDLAGALAQRRRFVTPGALLTERLRWVLDRQGPARVAGAAALQTLRYRLGTLHRPDA